MQKYNTTETIKADQKHSKMEFGVMQFQVYLGLFFLVTFIIGSIL